VRLVFCGTPQTSVPALEALLASDHEVVAVVTRPDAPSGRGRKLTPSPVAVRAAQAGVEILAPAKVREPEFLDRLIQIAPDCCPVVAYGALIPGSALGIPRHGWVNLHFSLLPAWRGAAPVQHAILHGDEITGAATFQIEEGLDTGPVFGVVTEPILPTDTSGDLLGRLAVSGAGLLVATMDGIETGELEPRPQPAEGVSLAPKIGVEDARVDWTTPALHIDRQIRACTPAPGAWTTFRGERLKIHPITVSNDSVGFDSSDAGQFRPGQFRTVKNEIVVGTGSRPVVLGEVQPQGKKPMQADAWARGVRLTDEDRLA
jgi:methionyl-tRNA formyltransferase